MNHYSIVVDTEGISLKKVIISLAVFLVIIAIPLTVYLVQRQQETRGRAEVVPETAVVVTINGQDFTKADVRQVAEEQYEEAGVDDQALKDALEVLIERKILDIESASLGVSLDPEEVRQKAQEEQVSQTEANYDLLREKITFIVTNSRRLISMGVWSPIADAQIGFISEEKEIAALQTSNGLLALTEIQTKLSQGQDPVEIANSIISKYPNLETALTINGSKLYQLTDEEKQIISRPRIVEFGDSNMDQTTLNGVFSMEQDETRKISQTETNSAGAVFKVLEKGNENGEESYTAWFAKKKEALVIYKTSL